MASKEDLDKSVQREMDAMGVIYTALRKLDAPAQRWVLRCVMDRLGLGPLDYEHESQSENKDFGTRPDPISSAPTLAAEPAAVDGISPVASKWMVRNGFTAASLASFYSLGQDELDLVAKSVPGSSKKDRMRSVFLLQGVASYLSTGVARMSHEKIKVSCVHYDAFDPPNFAKYVRVLSREVGGTKEAGYQLTAAGLSSATEMIKELITGDQSDSSSVSPRKGSKK